MRKLIRFLLLMLSLATAGAAMAAATPFEAARFDALMQEGKPVLVAVHADWCPTCQVQAPIVEALLKRPEFSGISALRVDFDNQKEIVKGFKATMQSTLILFKGGKEVGRSLGDTSQEGIAALLRKAL